MAFLFFFFSIEKYFLVEFTRVELAIDFVVVVCFSARELAMFVTHLRHSLLKTLDSLFVFLISFLSLELDVFLIVVVCIGSFLFCFHISTLFRSNIDAQRASQFFFLLINVEVNNKVTPNSNTY